MITKYIHRGRFQGRGLQNTEDKTNQLEREAVTVNELTLGVEGTLRVIISVSPFIWTPSFCQVIALASEPVFT